MKQDKTLGIDLYAAMTRLRLPGLDAEFFTVEFDCSSCNCFVYSFRYVHGFLTIKLYVYCKKLGFQTRKPKHCSIYFNTLCFFLPNQTGTYFLRQIP